MLHFTSAAFFLFILFLLPKESHCNSLRHMKLYEYQAKLQEKTSASSTTATSPLPSNIRKSDGRVFYPIGYGADPSGAQDSTEAIQEALSDALKTRNGLELLPGISDLGGVVIDLQGGNYKISNPVRFPPGIGDILVQRGTVRASNTFPGDRHLIELWSPNSVKFRQNTYSQDSLSDRRYQNNGIYYEGITFRDILFDSSYRGGGLLIIESARVRVSNCFFIHFSTEGILVERGHETLISSSFLGQHPTVGGDRGEKDYSATAIDLDSNDNAVTDVVIFSAAVGIVLRGQANIVTGVHCYNKATYFGGVGMLVKAALTRIVNCYLDYNSIVIEDPNQVLISNGFFLGDGNIVLKSIKGQISGLNIVDNMFSGDAKKMVPIVKLDGQFSSVDQVVIDHNMVNGMSLRSTVGKLTVAGNGTRKWVADFSSVLVFPNRINHVQYSFYCGGEADRFPKHVLRNVSNNVVVVETEKEVDGLVSFLVDQHNMVGERDFFL